ncbi:24 kDa outer membrane protein [Thalassocella blandensis]|nr:24 kDa outer membrane protein [Thalassocella blandensis]
MSSDKPFSNRSAVYVAISVLSVLHANKVTADDGSGTVWGIGIGAGTKEELYTDFDDKNRVLPILFVDNKWLRLTGPNLDIKLGSLHNFNFSLRSKFALGDGYEAKDAEILQGMSERKASIWVGPNISWQSDFVEVSLGGLFDAMDYSNGKQANLDISKTFRLSQRLRLEPSVGVVWQDANYIDYYYGVEEDEVLLDRTYYEGEETVSTKVSINLSYGLSRNKSISLMTGIKTVAEEIENSPLVESDSASWATLAFIYRF